MAILPEGLYNCAQGITEAKTDQSFAGRTGFCCCFVYFFLFDLYFNKSSLILNSKTLMSLFKVS